MIGSWHAGAGRRGWTSTVLLLAGTLAVSLASYSISMSVSAERAAVERLARENAAMARQLKALDAEYRVRMRLPQLERWNRDVLGLKPIDAAQFLDSPLLLASYGKPVAALQQAPVLAVLRDAPAAAAGHDSPAPLRPVAAAAGTVPAPDAELLAAVAALAAATAAPERPQLTAVALADGGAAAEPPVPR